MKFAASLLLLSAVSAAPGSHQHPVELVGPIKTLAHDVSGTVYILDEHTLFVQDFTYDGNGPDGFFWAGTEGSGPTDVGTILPYPFTGEFYEYEDGNAPILQGAFNGVNITLTTPPELKTDDIKWLSVWCRAYKVDFGHVIIDHAALDAANAEPEGESEPESHDDDAYAAPEGEPEGESEPEGDHTHDLPPPLLEPESNSHDHHHHHDDDDVPYPESEAEAEAEPKTGGASALTSASSLLVSLAITAASVVLSS